MTDDELTGRHELRVMESRTYLIQARLEWNDTGVEVLPGQRYQLNATGRWLDASISAGPSGYISDRWLFRLAERLRRCPHENWFALVGVVGHDYKSAFVVGERAQVSIRSSGTLSFFANDLPLFYGNNSGALSLVIMRES